MHEVTITDEGKRAVQQALLQVLRQPECLQAQTDPEYLQLWVDQAKANAESSESGQPFVRVPEELRQFPDVEQFELKAEWNPPLYTVSATGD